MFGFFLDDMKLLEIDFFMVRSKLLKKELFFKDGSKILFKIFKR